MSDDAVKLLIVKTSSIGDVVHALPAAEIVKEHLPSATIGWVVRERCADLLTGNPFVDSIYRIPDKPSLIDLNALGRELRAAAYDAAWDMQGLSLSGIVTRLSAAPRRIGLDLNREGNRWFLTEPVVPARIDRGRHAITILRGFLPTLGIDPDTPWPPLRHLETSSALPPEWRNSGSVEDRIALNIGASSVYKQWPATHWTRLIELLVDGGRQPLLIGGPQDVAAAGSILVEAAGSFASREPVSFVGKTTLRQTAAVLSRCAALVTADTGPMHLAAAMRVPVVALFGPTDPVKTGPYGTEARIIKHECCTVNHRRPLCDGAAYCMKSITAEAVFANLEELLAVPAIPHMTPC